MAYSTSTLLIRNLRDVFGDDPARRRAGGLYILFILTRRTLYKFYIFGPNGLMFRIRKVRRNAAFENTRWRKP